MPLNIRVSTTRFVRRSARNDFWQIRIYTSDFLGIKHPYSKGKRVVKRRRLVLSTPLDAMQEFQDNDILQLIPKHPTRWTGFDDKILSLYARGMTVREIQGHLEECERVAA